MFGRKIKILDTVLIDGLKKEGSEKQRHENYLFDTYNYLIKVGMKKHRFSEEEALTVYIDTVLATIRNIETERFKGESIIKTYITSIFHRKCVDLIRKKTTKKTDVLPIDDFYSISDSVKSVLEQLILKEKVVAITEKIQHLGEKCRIILEKWALGYSDKELAQITVLGFKNATTVKATRHRCLKKLKAL